MTNETLEAVQANFLALEKLNKLLGEKIEIYEKYVAHLNTQLDHLVVHLGHTSCDDTSCVL